MSQIVETIDVNVPVRTAYDQWTQFEEFPLFMDAVEKVEQIDDTHLAWAANLNGVKKEWKAEIPQIEEWFAKFGDNLPTALQVELDGLKARLGA